MDTTELLKKVRKIEIKTKGLSTQLFSGEYHSAFKGRGMAFSEVREYQAGDEVRTIDWNVSARMGDPYVKVFEEERELTVMLLVDVSASGLFGTKSKSKKELITELSAVLAFSAIQNNDKVGVLLFSDRIEKFIPPKKGKSHILQIIRHLLEVEPKGKQTDIKKALDYFTNTTKKRSTVFLLSDFVCHTTYQDALKMANKRHDLVAVEVYDTTEVTLPNVGMLPVKDLETGATNWLNTSSKLARDTYQSRAVSRKSILHEMFKKSGIDFADISTEDDYVKQLMGVFKRR